MDDLCTIYLNTEEIDKCNEPKSNVETNNELSVELDVTLNVELGVELMLN